MILQKSCRPSRLSSRPSLTLASSPAPPVLPRAGRFLFLSGLLGLFGLLVLSGLFFLLAADLPRLLDGIVYVTRQVEGLLGQLVVPALDDLLERADRVVELEEFALEAGELLGHEERLR